MDAAQTTITVLGAGTGGLILKSLVDAGIKFFTGTAGREKIRNADMKTQRDEAWARAEEAVNRADREARNRRKTEEYASALRRDCMDHGMKSEQIRPWPKLETE